MFTGIVETMGQIAQIREEGTNVHVTIKTALAADLKIDQSVAHNGVCLTVVAQDEEQYTVTAIDETLQKTNLGDWKEGDFVNLERAMQHNARLDGHIVQGHVDTTGTCTGVKEVDGSWIFSFKYTPNELHLLVDKGSVCINGTSLTVVDPTDATFSVAIIPYTFENTIFKFMKAGDAINLEFDILGKYIARYAKLYMNK